MEWISVGDRVPKGMGAIVRVRRENGDEIKAYFHQDKMEWLHYYCRFPWTYFQDKKTLEWLTDVTHWMPLPGLPKE